MATFYLLPPRPALAAALPRLLGLTAAPAELGVELADALRSGLNRGDCFAIFREELPDSDNVGDALSDGFGAELGDEVIELRLGADQLRSRSWRIGLLSAA